MCYNGGMEPIEQDEKQHMIRLPGYEIEFHASRFKGFGFAILIGEGMYYKSIRVEFTIPLFTCGFHVIRDEA